MSSNDSLHPDVLKEKQRRLRDGFSTPLTLRVHRALSWLRRAQAEANDLDVRFILLWIGFNAAYLSEALRNMDGERVVIALDKPTSAAVLTPADGGQEEMLCLVMPLRIQE